MIRLDEVDDTPDDYMALPEIYDDSAINSSMIESEDMPERTARILSYKIVRTQTMLDKEIPEPERESQITDMDLAKNLNEDHFYKEQKIISPLKRNAIKKKSKLRLALDNKILSLSYRMKKYYFHHKEM
jgi:hypothetical protein